MYKATAKEKACLALGFLWAFLTAYGAFHLVRAVVGNSDHGLGLAIAAGMIAFIGSSLLLGRGVDAIQRQRIDRERWVAAESVNRCPECGTPGVWRDQRRDAA
jgi:hypothetical protein